MSFLDNSVSYRVESKYLGYQFLLSPMMDDKTEIKECTDVTCSLNEDDDTLYIGFDSGFAPLDECLFIHSNNPIEVV